MSIDITTESHRLSMPVQSKTSRESKRRGVAAVKSCVSQRVLRPKKLASELFYQAHDLRKSLFIKRIEDKLALPISKNDPCPPQNREML